MTHLTTNEISMQEFVMAHVVQVISGYLCLDFGVITKVFLLLQVTKSSNHNS